MVDSDFAILVAFLLCLGFMAVVERLHLADRWVSDLFD